MAIQVQGFSGDSVEVDDKRAFRTIIVNRGNGHSVAAVTGTMAAGLAATSGIFAMRLNPGASVSAFIERIRIQFTTIAAFTTPVTAGRALWLFRGAGASATGGTVIAEARPKHSVSASSQFDASNGGDMRVSTTIGLGLGGISFEPSALKYMSIVHAGTAGAHYETTWEFASTENAPLVLDPGQLIVLGNPTAMGAGGTWQMAINVDWHEASVF